MGGKGRHPDKALTSVGVRALKKPGRYADGNGLYLVVDPSGSKRWLLRTMVQGRRCDIGLGGANLISLAEARENALHELTSRPASANATVLEFAIRTGHRHSRPRKVTQAIAQEHEDVALMTLSHENALHGSAARAGGHRASWPIQNHATLSRA